MANTEKATERFITQVTPSLKQRVRDWRRVQEDMPNESEAIRRLLDIGLEAEEQAHA